jgi:hypothetical protein
MHDPTERFGGVEWATVGHAVAVVDPQGRIVGKFGVSHTADGLADLYLRLSKAKVRRVPIERFSIGTFPPVFGSHSRRRSSALTARPLASATSLSSIGTRRRCTTNPRTGCYRSSACTGSFK